jgi:hypothetical protein
MVPRSRRKWRSTDWIISASLIAVSPIAPPPDLPRMASAAVRLTTSGVTDVLSGLGSLDPLGSLSGLTNDLGSLANLGGFGDGSLANIPYNLFADLVNIPYYESLALQEYAYALGPAGSVGGVAGWIPPGTPSTGIADIGGQEFYALGGTGSWWMESIGNTWGWDNGNWPQLDAIVHFLLPFQFTESYAEQLQLLEQAEIIDGAQVNCEYECADVLGYVGNWFNTPLTQLLSLTHTFPNTIADTIGSNAGSIINVGPTPPGSDLVIWAGQPGTLYPLAPLEATAANLTGSPANNPIMLPDPANVLTSATQLFNDFTTNFNPFVTGSFLYWGAPTDYSVPAFLAGMLQDFTGIPNQFVDIGQWQPNGAEPLWGYDASPLTLLSPTEGLPAGIEYLGQGLLGYLNPEIYLQALSNDVTGLIASPENPASLLNDIPFATFLLGGLFDPSTLLGDFSSLVPNAGADLASMLGPNLAADLSSLLPNAAALGATIIPDLALNLLALF